MIAVSRCISRINPVVILLGWFKQKWRGVRFEKGFWEFTNCSQNLSMEGKYAVKSSITELPKISR